ncbi:MAG TPA: YdeI/OmpD-associated family protein [Dermatophilaceae bacterium]|nr:YdeI/OmpD-associated family protein [Dermatophilaceae bacterium]
MNEATPWVEFDAVIEVLPWGRNAYTIIRLEKALELAARAAGTRRVEGTIDDLPVNVGVNRADVLPDAFMYAGKGMLRRLGARPGDVVSCRLRPADPDEVPLADDVHGALADAGRLAAFQRKNPPDRRRLLQPIEDAAKPETRQQRIAALLRSLPPD